MSWQENLEQERVRAQAEADVLPTHPALGRWEACFCGSRHCRLVYPTNIGTFMNGTGFSHDEARRLVRAFADAENG